MKKYFNIFKFELMTNLQYVYTILFRFLSVFAIIFIFLNLWNYLYDDPSQLINGYSKVQMLWYIIITEVLWMSLSGRKIARDISDDVKSGNIAININKPYSYVGYKLATNLGDMIIPFISFFGLSMIMGYLFLGSYPSISVLSIICVLISCVLSTFISMFLIISIGLISFWIEDSGPLYWVYSKFILVFGTMFPIELFPKAIAKLLKYSPISAISYGPARLFTNFSISSAIELLSIQLVYIIISYIIITIIYRRGVKKLNVNGG